MNLLSGCNEKIAGDRHDVEKLELSYFAGGKGKCRTMVWPFFFLKQNSYYMDQNLIPYDYAQVK